jgi:hypothetical protein
MKELEWAGFTAWVAFALAAGATAACSGDGGSASTGTPPGPTTSAIAACGQSSAILQSTTWSTCLEGKTFKGRDPLNATTACEVRFLEGSRVELVHGATTYASESPASWGSGLYTNKQQGPTANDRQLIASLDSSKVVENRLHSLKVQIVTGVLDDMYDDTFEGTVFTAGLARTTFNCKLDDI